MAGNPARPRTALCGQDRTRANDIWPDDAAGRLCRHERKVAAACRGFARNVRTDRGTFSICRRSYLPGITIDTRYGKACRSRRADRPRAARRASRQPTGVQKRARLRASIDARSVATGFRPCPRVSQQRSARSANGRRGRPVARSTGQFASSNEYYLHATRSNYVRRAPRPVARVSRRARVS